MTLSSSFITLLADSAYVAPSLPVIFFSVYVLAAAAAGIVTATKGRWGWFIAGWLTSGLAFFVGATRSARPNSAWSRIRTSRARSTS